MDPQEWFCYVGMQCNVPDHTAVAVEDLDAAPGVPHPVLGREPALQHYM